MVVEKVNFHFEGKKIKIKKKEITTLGTLSLVRIALQQIIHLQLNMI